MRPGGEGAPQPRDGRGVWDTPWGSGTQTAPVFPAPAAARAFRGRSGVRGGSAAAAGPRRPRSREAAGTFPGAQRAPGGRSRMRSAMRPGRPRGCPLGRGRKGTTVRVRSALQPCCAPHPHPPAAFQRRTRCAGVPPGRARPGWVPRKL